MYFTLAFLIGFAFGWQRAKRRGGNRLDKLQYGAVHGIIFVLVALILLVGVQRIGWL
jgi:hypothetical protein